LYGKFSVRLLGTESRLVVSNISEMSRIQNTGLTLVALFLVGLFVHELRHFCHYGHLVPLGLHADVSIILSDEVLGVDGIAKIYDARLTNYGIFPNTIVVCDSRVAGAPATDVNYVVERWDRQSREWRLVPEWDFYGYRLFCRPAFEVSEEHLARHRLWPGQSIWVGGGIPAQVGGFHVGDDGRFTILLNADGDKANTISTSIFRVDQQAKNSHVSSPD
jgi:hypothetical protein